MILVVFTEAQKDTFGEKVSLRDGLYRLEPVRLDETRWILPRKVLIEWADEIPSAVKTRLQTLPTLDATRAEIFQIRKAYLESLKEGGGRV